MNYTFSYYLLLTLVVLSCPVQLYSAELSITDTHNITEILENEFKGAYPEKILPTGELREFELVAKQGTWSIVPPYTTSVWTYNGTIPGPVIRIKLGDTLKLTLKNELSQPTTIHWHGVRVPNAMDGVPGVTQPPIQPGDSFTYQFTPKDAGTFWFHPHINAAEQIERGLHGVLIVEDPSEPVYSQDLVWVLDDWLFTNGGEIYSKFVTRHDLAHDGRWGNLLTVNGKYQPTVKVKAGERIRIRMINVANGRVFKPVFEQLSPAVIAVDGMLAKAPFALQQFFVAPGNRVDLDIIIPQTAAGKTFVLQDAFTRNNIDLAFIQVASAEPIATPSFKSPQAQHFPLWSDALKIPVEHEFTLDARRGGVYGISWMIDDKVWLEGKAYELQSGKFTRLRINNKSSRLHPMHLHGQFFKVIAKNRQKVEENFWRDTVLVGPKESVDIGIVPMDKGLWANHCHILEHAESGMMSTIMVKE
ncbi:copper oxidase [Methyloprofundus sedimenti]|uniref:Copper oxidase n=1 Tax=Methyloprofundus sedimenti TaxID=1420851 RepID=A0A1V8M868_9GAMM|nr:multicopper oxidase family protein [Methyloprofundus sedimenti]OQK17718.1 copper oxidase [Methyloprofundus sedimenti]